MGSHPLQLHVDLQERRIHLLAEVGRLAKSMDASGQHDSTCETAGYFYTAHVVPVWDTYWKAIRPHEESGLPGRVATPAEAIQLVVAAFPFCKHLSARIDGEHL